MYVVESVLTCRVCSRTVQGKGGGVPAQLFYQDPVLSQAVLDKDFEESQGSLVADAQGRMAVSTGLYGVDNGAQAMFEREELELDYVANTDPLVGFPGLQSIRDRYWDQRDLVYRDPPSTHNIHQVTPYDKMTRYVQDYLHFKEVSHQLLICASHREPGPAESYAWREFVAESCPGTRDRQIRELLTPFH